MAGDWIKMRADLLRSPKVVQMASACNADRFRIAGGLLSVWSLFDAHSDDGRLKGYSEAMLDDLAAWAGFSASMTLVGWLEKEGDTLVLPRFEAHNGASAKRRVQDADRKRLSRKTSAVDAAKSVTIEEKNREEKITTKDLDASLPVQPKKRAKKTDPVDFSIWPTQPTESVMAQWLALRKFKKAPVSQIVVESLDVEFRKAERFGYSVDDCLRFAVKKNWRGFEFDWMQGEPELLSKMSRPAAPAGHKNLRDVSIEEQLSDKDWAAGYVRHE